MTFPGGVAAGDNRGMKRHVVGKKRIRHYAGGRVLVICHAYDCTKIFVKGGDPKLWNWILGSYEILQQGMQQPLCQTIVLT